MHRCLKNCSNRPLHPKRTIISRFLVIENACLSSSEHKAELNPQEAAITKRFGMGENDFATMTRWRKRFGRKDPGLVHALPNDTNLIVRTSLLQRSVRLATAKSFLSWGRRSATMMRMLATLHKLLSNTWPYLKQKLQSSRENVRPGIRL